jgi:uncharacterized protein (TIGR03083 family)
MDVIDDYELRDLDPFTLLDSEMLRVDGFLSTLGPAHWGEPTRCKGWNRRHLLAHLASDEEYAIACLDGRLGELLEAAARAGASDLDGWNAWQVRRREGRAVDELLAEWRRSSAEDRRRLRALGWDARLVTQAGPYPAGLQAFHYAAEYAVHADDMGVPVADGERELRTRWRARFARFALREAGRPVRVEERGGLNLVETVDPPGVSAELTDEDLVEAVQARLPAESPVAAPLQEALRALA